jgi:uncharacterized protein involved in exopolysaccharide biosynthesis
MILERAKGHVDDVDFQKVANGLWKDKYLISFVFLLIVGITGYQSFKSPNLFQSRMVLFTKGDAPANSALGGLKGVLGLGGNSGQDFEKVAAILDSDDFLLGFIKKEELLKQIFSSSWDASSKSWKLEKEQKPPTLLDGVVAFRKNAFAWSLIDGKPLLEFSVIDTDPIKAHEILEKFQNYFLETLDDGKIKSSKRKQQFYKQKMREANDFELRMGLQKLLVREIEESLIIGQERFQVIDTPKIPEKKIGPNRKLSLVIGAVAGLILGFSLSLIKLFFAIYLKKQK